MNIVISPKDLKLRNIHFHDAVTNTVMDDSSFVRVGYSNTDVTLNGIYLDISLNVSRIDKYFHKYKYIFEYMNNMECIDMLVRIERMILENLPTCNARNVYKLKEQFLHNSIRIREYRLSTEASHPGTYNFTLKISGIWVTDSDCGLTFKFFSQN